MPAGDIIKSKVFGVTFANDDGSDRQRIIREHCRPGVSLAVVHEPNNPHSPDGTALGLWVPAITGSQSRMMKIGHIRDGLSGDILDYLDEGLVAKVRILEVTGGTKDKPSLGVSIEIEMVKAARSPRRPRAVRPVQAISPPSDFHPGDYLYVAWRYVQWGYQSLPDWAQPILWGGGIAAAVVAAVLAVKAMAR